MARIDEGRIAFKILTGKHLGWPRRGYQEDNIRIDPKEICITRNWVDSVQDRDY